MCVCMIDIDLHICTLNKKLDSADDDRVATPLEHQSSLCVIDAVSPLTVTLGNTFHIIRIFDYCLSLIYSYILNCIHGAKQESKTGTLQYVIK